MARPRSDIAPRIVHAARDRFLNEGVDGASLRTIAEDAGTSIGMVYYYFPTKDDLFLAVVEEVYAKLLEGLTAALAPDGTNVKTRLRRAFLRLGKMSDDESKVIRLIVREALVSSTRLDRIVERSLRGHVPLLLKTIAEGIADGEIDGAIPPPLLLISTFALGGIPQVARRVAGAAPIFQGLGDSETLATQQIELLFRAIGAKAKTKQKRRAVTRARRPA
jgi:AcrR family transcriptional regulator